MKKLFIIFVLLIMISACTKNLSHDTFTPDDNSGLNDTTWLNNSVANPLNDTLQNIFNSFDFYTDGFLEEMGASFQFFGSDSLQLNFPAGCCINPANNTVIPNGAVHFKIIALKAKGDFIRAMIPTSSYKTILKATKVFDLRLMWNGMDVNINPSSPVTINWLDKNANSNTKLYTGVSLSNPDSLYTFNLASSNAGSVQVINYPSSSVAKGYRLTTSSAINLFGAFSTYDASANDTRLNVIMPVNFTNKNTVVFAVFKNSQTVIRLASDYATSSFYATGIPFNTVLNIIALSKIDNRFYWADSSIIFNSNNAVKITPHEKSIADINIALDAL